MTYILWSSDFVLHLEEYLMYEHHTLGLRVSIVNYTETLKFSCTLYYDSVLITLANSQLRSCHGCYYDIMTSHDVTEYCFLKESILLVILH